MINLDLLAKYLALIDSVPGTLYLDGSGEIIEALRWMYQANHIFSYSIVLLQLGFILFVVIALPVVIVSFFTYERRKMSRW